jgi:hypothetical protein
MKRIVGYCVVGLLLLAACGGGGVPLASPARDSGQSALMDKTVAGQHRCDPKSHERPFVIEWDATDMSSFEAKTASDVVFVKYEGCDIHVLEGCSNDSIKGALGAYGPVEWTSGSVEKVDIANEGELYAKLPLGVASLGGRVQAGEQFHMEYFVSGTRKATRDEMYSADLASIPRCRGATHFVYAYNLGAFALGSAKQLNAQAGASVWGIGAGAISKSVSNAEKKGGILPSCSGETAKETSTCKVPIRLTLRAVSEGANPDAAAAVAPETPSALNLAGKVDTKIKMSEEARGRYESAVERMSARDGKACLKELNAFDKLDPKHASGLARSPLASTRAFCAMLSGMCDAGKVQLRKAWEGVTQLDATALDAAVEAQAANYCQGSSMSPRDQFLKAARDLQQGATSKKDVAYCKSNVETLKKLALTIKPRDDEDHLVKNALSPYGMHMNGVNCFARAGDCESAYSGWKSYQAATHDGLPLKSSELAQRDEFVMSASSCKAWAARQPLSARDHLVRAMQELQRGAREKIDAATCRKNHETVTRLASSVTLEPDDHEAKSATNESVVSTSAMMCFAKAGDCASAEALLSAVHPTLPEASRRTMLGGMASSCKR